MKLKPDKGVEEVFEAYHRCLDVGADAVLDSQHYNTQPGYMRHMWPERRWSCCTAGTSAPATGRLTRAQSSARMAGGRSACSSAPLRSPPLHHQTHHHPPRHLLPGFPKHFQRGKCYCPQTPAIVCLGTRGVEYFLRFSSLLLVWFCPPFLRYISEAKRSRSTPPLWFLLVRYPFLISLCILWNIFGNFLM